MSFIQEILFKLNASSKKKVYPVDFHIHTNWTDGQNSIQEMYDSSISKGVKAIFFYTMGGSKAYHDIYDTADNLTLSKYNEVFQWITDFIAEYK